MKRIDKGLLVLIIVLYIVSCQKSIAYAQEGYTYTYDYWGEMQYSPDAYDVAGIYTCVELGLDEGFKNPQGMFVRNNTIYVCDTGNNRIIELSREDTETLYVTRIIDCFYGNLDLRTFSGPTDIFASEDGYLYICDKGNNRIVKLDNELNYILEFLKPDDTTIDRNQSFLPNKLVVDGIGRVFCIADNINKGLIKYEPDGSFTGFIGASEVIYSWYDYIWKKISTQAQRSAMESFVPTEYDNIYMDYEGFVYACTTNIDESDLVDDAAKPIRKLNMMGADILIKNGNFPPIGDVEWDDGGGYTGPSLITDVTAVDNIVYFGLDKVRGRLFAYDSQGNLLYAFGGNGNMDGYFKLPVAIEHIGYDILVLDSEDASMTLFTLTDYGALIYKAIEEYTRGEYTNSGETWEQVLALNGNYDLAYIGIGRSLLRQEKYKDAMEYFKLKRDRYNYSRAFKLYRKVWVEDHIVILFVVAILVLIIPLTAGKIKKTKHMIDMINKNNTKETD